jgi:hypothetical protein
VKRGSDPESLAATFAREVAAQTDEVWKGDPKAGNRHAKRYIAAFAKLRALGDPGREALVPLLRHERPDVRVMAAAYLLRHRTTEALAVLRGEARGNGMVSFEAGQAIARWEDGTWALDPADPA